LEESGAERVADNHADRERRSSASLRRDLHRNVTDREEQSAGDPFGDRECAEPPPEREHDGRRSGRRREPEKDLGRRATGTLTAPTRQRHRQREQPEHRQEHTPKLVATEAAAAQTCGGVGEDPDPARGDALDERERCERKCGDVEREAAALEREPEQPAAVRQERFDRVKRSPKRKSG